MSSPIRKAALAAVLLATALSTGGCVVAPGGGWCYWHPYRCR